MESTPHVPSKNADIIELSDSCVPAAILSYDETIVYKIFGNDSRKEVKDTTQAPYQWVCRLSMTFSGKNYVGTGWLCSTNSSKYDVVVTSGHCVYETSTGKFAESVTVVPGADGKYAPWGAFTVGPSNLRASAGWKAAGPNKSDFDYGAILIPKTNCLGACAMWVDKSPVNKQALISGYPGSNPSNAPYGYNWDKQGPIESADSNTLFYTIDTSGGQSGSPVFALKAGSNFGHDNYINIYSIGIHWGYIGNSNAAMRMTSAVFNDVIEWSK
ncbi:glutamyl endopeptidase-like [Clytia hemisphaerica]|uniref:glutamyl endopeptidase-like n=1 Tax=Clytia hemisphaerica TaxID=252671 RepID=UPI0034D4DFBF